MAALSALCEMGPDGLVRFSKSIEAEWIEEALTATATASVRRRRLPADQVVWLVVGMGLFEDRSIHDVVKHLGLALGGPTPLAGSAVPKARSRLGADPLKWLFHRASTAWGEGRAASYRGLSVFAIDGSHLRVPDTDENYAHFGKPKVNESAEGAYPQVRVACLLNVATRLMVDVRYAPYNTAERVVAEPLFHAVPDNSVVLLDRGLFDFRVFTGLRKAGDSRHVLVRLKSNFNADELERLADGSIRVRVAASGKLRRKVPEIEPLLEGRVIEYHHPGGEPGRLFTTLPAEYPASELVALYRDRWELEIAFDELKTHMLERRESLRSKTPEAIEQELWGIFIAYNLVRREMLLAAEAQGAAPRRMSFWSSLLFIRNFFFSAWRTAPGNVPRMMADLRTSLAVLLPPRRTARRNPRHVKIVMSKFPSNRRKRSVQPKTILEPEESPK